MVVDRSGLVLNIVVSPEGAKGERLDQSSRTLSFSCADHDKKADKITLTVNNWDLAEFDNPIFRKGGFVAASWGYGAAMHPTVTCVIQSVKGAQTLTIECLAKSVLRNKTRKPRTFRGMKRSDVAEQLAAEAGYAGDSVHIEDTLVTYDTIPQAGLTDAQFLTRMAKQEGFVWYEDWAGWHFHRPNLGQTPRRVLHWYSDPASGDVKSLDIENDVTARAGSVSVKGRDPMKRKNFEAKADNASTKREGLAPQPETQGKTYSMNAASGERSLRNLVTHEEKHSAAPTEAAAKRSADASYRKTQLGTVKLKATIVGDPLLLAKTIVEWRGLGKRLSGNYYVSSVTHKIDASGGYVCELECKRDGHNESKTPLSAAKVNTQKGKDDKTPENGPQYTISSQQQNMGEKVRMSGGPNDK